MTAEATPSTLEAIASVSAQQRALAAELERRIGRARQEGHSWARIGTALGTSRQVVQERYGTPTQRVQPIDIPALTGTAATAVRHIDGSAGIATITVDITHDGAAQQLVFRADSRRWSGQAAAHPVSREGLRQALASLPREAQEQLEAAGAHAQRIAVARQAGIANRQATIAARQSPVGRPLRQR